MAFIFESSGVMPSFERLKLANLIELLITNFHLEIVRFWDLHFTSLGFL